MPRPVSVKPRPDHHLWLRFSDGVEGELDLGSLVGQGVFKAWQNRSFFESVRIADHGALVWGKDVELCPDAMYLALTGMSAEELFPNLGKTRIDA